MRVAVASSLQQSSRPWNGVVVAGLVAGAVAGERVPVSESMGGEVAGCDWAKVVFCYRCTVKAVLGVRKEVPAGNSSVREGACVCGASERERERRIENEGERLR